MIWTNEAALDMIAAHERGSQQWIHKAPDGTEFLCWWTCEHSLFGSKQILRLKSADITGIERERVICETRQERRSGWVFVVIIGGMFLLFGAIMYGLLSWFPIFIDDPLVFMFTVIILFMTTYLPFAWNLIPKSMEYIAAPKATSSANIASILEPYGFADKADDVREGVYALLTPNDRCKSDQ